MITPSRRHSPMVAIAAAAALLITACSADTGGRGRDHANEVVARVASYDLMAGRTGRFIVGLLHAADIAVRPLASFSPWRRRKVEARRGR